MRTIKISSFYVNKSHVFVLDWNFKKWSLTKNTNETLYCSELNANFNSIVEFVEILYGREKILALTGREAFQNYIIEWEE